MNRNADRQRWAFVRKVLVGMLFLLTTVVDEGNAQFDNYVTDYNAITIVDPENVVMQNPLFGGFNNPVPQLVDIDLDGDLDLFVQEERSRLQLYLNVGNSTTPLFKATSRNYQGLDIGDWYRFADADDDGDVDLFVEQPFNAIRYFESTGGANPSFIHVADTLFTSSSEVITTESPNVPVIEDIDCNGRLDLLLGRLDGSVSRYEQVIQPGGLPVFDFVEDNFQDIMVVGPLGPLGKDAPRHGANVLDLADVDGNGTLDLLWGDFFETSLITFSNNTSDCSQVNLELFSDTLASTNMGPFITRGYNAPATGDLTGDGVVDLVVGTLSNATVDDEKNLALFEHDGSGSYTWLTDELIFGVDVGSSSVPALVDLNGDGLDDLVVANSIGDSGTSAELIFYVAGPTNNSFTHFSSDFLDVELGFSYHPDFGDLDADGDYDLVLGTFEGVLIYLENAGTPVTPEFSVSSEDLIGEDVGSNSAPELVDLDSDGDLDLVVGESSGSLNYYENTSTTNLTFLPDATMFDGIDVGQGSAPAFVDADSDGDLDMLVGSENSGLFYFENTGTSASPTFESSTGVVVPLLVPQKATPEILEDFPNSGSTGILVGGISGGLLLFSQPGSSSIPGRDPERKSDLQLFPNPVQSVLHVVVEGRVQAPARIEIFDILGRAVFPRSVGDLSSGERVRVDVSSLPPGVYVIRVDDGRNQKRSRPFVRVE